METDVELKETVKKKTTHFKFITLYKDPDTLIVNGRLVAYAPGVHVSYDEETDDVMETQDNKKATYITFCFDVKNETIGFVPKLDFGRKQFIDRFRQLIEKLVPEVGEIEIILESDKQLLNEKLRKVNLVEQLTVDLIPPNNDKKLFESLFGLNSDDLAETGGRKFTFNIRGTAEKGLDVTSAFIKNLINGVIVGYGKLTARGKNTSGEPAFVNSEEQALYTKGIADINKDSIPEIEEKTRAGYVSLVSMKLTAREDLLKKQRELKSELLRKIEDEETKTGA